MKALGKKSMNKNQWLELINARYKRIRRASSIHAGPPNVDWETIMEWEGGYGTNKLRSIEDCMKLGSTNTWPGVWFQSKQTDYSPYNQEEYIASLLFGRQISGNSIALAAKHMLNENPATKKFFDYRDVDVTYLNIIDWGGSIFTSIDLWDMLSPHTPQGKRLNITMINFESPQLAFAKDCIDYYEPFGESGAKTNIFIEDEKSVLTTMVTSSDIFPGDGCKNILVLSEVLEHVQRPVEYLINDIGSNWSEGDPFMAYIANSFCTIAYGHHIPITIEGEERLTVRTANKAFYNGMERVGFTREKIEGYNSRLNLFCK